MKSFIMPAMALVAFCQATGETFSWRHAETYSGDRSGMHAISCLRDQGLAK
jgi:hypothetical protein